MSKLTPLYLAAIASALTLALSQNQNKTANPEIERGSSLNSGSAQCPKSLTHEINASFGDCELTLKFNKNSPYYNPANAKELLGNYANAIDTNFKYLIEPEMEEQLKVYDEFYLKYRKEILSGLKSLSMPSGIIRAPIYIPEKTDSNFEL